MRWVSTANVQVGDAVGALVRVNGALVGRAYIGVFGLDFDQAQVRWRRVVDDRPVIPLLYGLDGRVIWTRLGRGPQPSALVALDPLTGETAWERDLDFHPQHHGFTVHDGLIVLVRPGTMSSAPSLRFHEPERGEPVRELPLDSSGGWLVPAGGRLYLGTPLGLRVIDGSTVSRLGLAQINSVVASGDDLYLWAQDLDRGGAPCLSWWSASSGEERARLAFAECRPHVVPVAGREPGTLALAPIEGRASVAMVDLREGAVRWWAGRDEPGEILSGARLGATLAIAAQGADFSSRLCLFDEASGAPLPAPPLTDEPLSLFEDDGALYAASWSSIERLCVVP